MVTGLTICLPPLSLLQTFALQMGTSPSCNVLDIDIYFSDAGDARAPRDANAPYKASTSSAVFARSGIVIVLSSGTPGRQKQEFNVGRFCWRVRNLEHKVSPQKTKSKNASRRVHLMSRRCRLEGPFRNERFPDFASEYPLLLLGEEERAPRKESDTNQGVGHRGPRSSQSRPKKKRSVRVAGSVRLRIGVTASSLPAGGTVMQQDCSDGKVADGAAVGDDDPPEISRRRTNTVDRRLRLGVGWVSLARLFGLAPSAVFHRTGKGTGVDDVPVAACDSGAAEQPGGIEAKRPRQPRRLSMADHRASSSAPAPDDDAEPVKADQASAREERGSCSGAPRASTRAAGRLCSPLPMPVSGISCRVIWCGVRVASFELCPETGLPLSPGEYLLDLPRGTAWRSCQLVLEVIVTDQRVQHPGIKEALEHWQRLHSQCGLDGGTSTPRAEDGPHHVLGRVAVGGQVRGGGKAKRYIRMSTERFFLWFVVIDSPYRWGDKYKRSVYVSEACMYRIGHRLHLL